MVMIMKNDCYHRSRDHSTLGVDFIWVVYNDHAFI